MNRSIDRRDIVPLLRRHFPALEDMTSPQVQDFLNARCGTAIKDEPNGAAFDAWRQALGKQGFAGVWPYTEVDLRTFKQREADMLSEEAERKAKLEQK